MRRLVPTSLGLVAFSSVGARDDPAGAVAVNDGARATWWTAMIEASHSVHAGHQSRCTRHVVSILRKGLHKDPFFVPHAFKLKQAMKSQQQ